MRNATFESGHNFANQVIDCEHSLLSLLSSSSRGKASRTPAPGILGEEKHDKRLGFLAPAFAISFRGSTNSGKRKNRDCSQSNQVTGVGFSNFHFCVLFNYIYNGIVYATNNWPKSSTMSANITLPSVIYNRGTKGD